MTWNTVILSYNKFIRTYIKIRRLIFMPEELNFFDVKGKTKFKSSEYRIEVRKGRRFAVSKAPSGIEAWRIIGKA